MKKYILAIGAIMLFGFAELAQAQSTGDISGTYSVPKGSRCRDRLTAAADKVTTDVYCDQGAGIQREGSRCHSRTASAKVRAR